MTDPAPEHIEPVSLGTLVEGALAELADRIEQAGQLVSVTGRGDVEVRADEVMLGALLRDSIDCLLMPDAPNAPPIRISLCREDDTARIELQRAPTRDEASRIEPIPGEPTPRAPSGRPAADLAASDADSLAASRDASWVERLARWQRIAAAHGGRLRVTGLGRDEPAEDAAVHWRLELPVATRFGGVNLLGQR